MPTRNKANKATNNARSAGLLAAMALTGCAHVGGADTAALENAAPNTAAINSTMATIKADPSVQAALSTIEGMNQLNIDRLITLTEIPAPPFKEGKRADAYADMMKTAGLTDVSTDEVGNVIARRSGQNGARTVRCGRPFGYGVPGRH